MLNNVCLMGRITHTPEMKTTPNNTFVINFCLAVKRNRSANGEIPVDFIDCVAWGKTAEFINTYFQKGQMIAVQGSIQTRTYVDKEGKNRKAVEILVDNVHFVEPKKQSEHDDKQTDNTDFSYMVNSGDLPF